MAFLRERAPIRAWIGIVLALLALPLLSYQPPENGGPVGVSWLIGPLAVFVVWGFQGYLMKFSNRSMTAESIFFYMAAGAVLLIPAAWRLTDFSQPINWGWRGPWLAAAIQVLNSIGALCLVYALRYGKAIIVVPMTALAPVSDHSAVACHLSGDPASGSGRGHRVRLGFDLPAGGVESDQTGRALDVALVIALISAITFSGSNTDLHSGWKSFFLPRSMASSAPSEKGDPT